MLLLAHLFLGAKRSICCKNKPIENLSLPNYFPSGNNIKRIKLSPLKYWLAAVLVL